MGVFCKWVGLSLLCKVSDEKDPLVFVSTPTVSIPVSFFLVVGGHRFFHNPSTNPPENSERDGCRRFNDRYVRVGPLIWNSFC